MTQKTINSLLNETYSKPPKTDFSTNKTDVYHIDDIWSLDIFYLTEYGPESSGRSRYVFVVIDTFNKLGWTIPLKSKIAQTIKNCFKNVLMCSKRYPILIETDRGKKILSKTLTDSLK